MAARTTHIIPNETGWIVKKERPNPGSSRMAGDAVAASVTFRTGTVYATQREAIQAAMKDVRNAPRAQIVVHSRTGSFRQAYVHGLPTIQTPHLKSKLGTKAIERAVSSVVRKRLAKA